MTKAKKMLPMPRVGFACNWPETGMFAGACYGISVSVRQTISALDLGGGEFDENCDPVGPKLEFTGTGVKLGDREFPCAGYREWVGNWCWNEVGMKAADVADLVAHALTLKCFDVEGASGPLCDYDPAKHDRDALLKMLRRLQHAEVPHD
jgi:hypothetical protein